MKIAFFDFLKKYKYVILIYIICGILLFYIKPRQEDYYFENDVDSFEENYYLIFSIYSILFLLMIVLIVNIIRKTRLKNILINLLGTFIFSCTFFILFHSNILSVILLGNRIKSIETETRSYKIIDITNNKYLSAINLHTENDVPNEDEYLKYFDNNGRERLKVGDTLNLEIHRGIFGINYIYK